MRKTITMMLVMLVLMTAVFATTDKETHVITLKSTVEAQPPAFQLGIGANKTNTGVTVFADDAAYPPGDPLVYDVANIATSDIEVTFSAYLANAAKARAAYTLEFKPGSFAVTRSGVAGTVAPSSDSGKTAVTPKTGLTGVSVADAAGGYKVTATFNGTTCAADTVLADFKLTYVKDPTVDPNSEGYTATVTLEITTEA